MGASWNDRKCLTKVAWQNKHNSNHYFILACNITLCPIHSLKSYLVRKSALISNDESAHLEKLDKPVFLEIVQVGVSFVAKFRGSLNIEWAVRPPWGRVVAMLKEVTAVAAMFCCLVFARRRVVTMFFPVLPGAFRKTIPLLRILTLLLIE